MGLRLKKGLERSRIRVVDLSVEELLRLLHYVRVPTFGVVLKLGRFWIGSGILRSRASTLDGAREFIQSRVSLLKKIVHDIDNATPIVLNIVLILKHRRLAMRVLGGRFQQLVRQAQ